MSDVNNDNNESSVTIMAMMTWEDMREVWALDWIIIVAGNEAWNIGHMIEISSSTITELCLLSPRWSCFCSQEIILCKTRDHPDDYSCHSGYE